jgi:ERCC4-type nuclease
MARLRKPDVVFIIDSREPPETRYHFSRAVRRELAFGGERVQKLDEGDYAIEVAGAILPVRIERKTLPDLWAVCGYGRERFERELGRLRAFERSYLLIEANWADLLRGYERSQIPGRTILASVASWQDEFGIAAQFCGDRRAARAWCQRLLEEAAVRHWRDINGLEAVRGGGST